MPRPQNAPAPSPAPKAARRIVDSPWRQNAIPSPSERTRAERKKANHDGLCITQMPQLSGCRCNCTRCWDKLASKVICSADFSAFPLGS
jgi:hypothetical protein